TKLLIRIAVDTDSEWAMFAQAMPSIATYLIIDVLGCLLFAFVATYYILRPVEKLTREAMGGGEVKTDYPEFATIAEVLNERNRNIAWHMQEVEEEKQLVVKAQNSKNEFIANVTHEMNTPLTSIRGYAELLSSGMLNAEQQKQAYETITAQSERLSNLIACIINYNEIDQDDLPSYDVDLSKLAREMLAVVKPEADKRNVQLVDRIDDNVIVKSRHERITQLVGNLVRNAIRYNKEGGTVTVTLTYKQLTVEDTGIGIAPENMEKVFSRFFTVDKSHSGKNGGFGLGLAVCKKICNRAGWRISVESELGKGSKFTVDFGLQ
ncbi:MAG: sensor histidine kinase, partial [Candidatus Coproplasma sp.]